MLEIDTHREGGEDDVGVHWRTMQRIVRIYGDWRGIGQHDRSTEKKLTRVSDRNEIDGGGQHRGDKGVTTGHMINIDRFHRVYVLVNVSITSYERVKLCRT